MGIFFECMIFSQEDFLQNLKKGALKIAVIGMSNTGKSYRSQQLHKECGFERYCVDDLIGTSLGFEGDTELAHWLGQPNSHGFTERQMQYLQKEKELTLACPLSSKESIVLDTTGSVIYLDDEVKEFLHKNFLVVQLDASASIIGVMMEDFFVHPKALIWGESFSQQKEESDVEALRRCYPLLLKDRIEKYRSLGEVFLPAEISRSAKIGIDRFLEIIRCQL